MTPGPWIRGWPPAAILCSLLLCVAAAALTIYWHAASLPYRDGFPANEASEWKSFGGTWELGDGAVFNRSDERGAKLVSGSAGWTDYELNVDLKLIGHEGDVGVIVRLGDEERGIDSYRGYYIGLRSADSALVVGRADHGWTEGRPVPMLGGVQIGTWYRLHIVAFGCSIGAEATNIDTGQTSWAALRDEDCFPSGKIGLRSMATGGGWRNVTVTVADAQALQTITSHVESIARPEFPARESDYSRMRERYFKSTYFPLHSYQDTQDADRYKEISVIPMPQISSIDAVRIPPLEHEEVTIRGVVTLTTPLYIQDSSGSIAIENSGPAELNLGDEVEISGRTVVNGFTAKFVARSIRLLWDRTLVVPSSVTSTQAASGAFDGSLVELRGILESKTVSPQHVITLHLYDTAQSFTATLHSGLSMQDYESWIPGSSLSIRGICAVPASPASTSTAFSIILRSNNDVQVLTGPPWWTGRQLIRLLFLTLLVVCAVVYFYLRLERWKIAAIGGERERLAHEMHDTLAQSLAGIGFHLQALYKGMRSGSTQPAEAVEMVHGACEMVAHGHREASACIAALHPNADQGQDFLVALERTTREMLPSRGQGVSLPMKFVREGILQQLSMQVRDALFHIGREAVSNMLRHAQASEMEVRLRYEPKEVIMEMRDNGVGFQTAQQSDGFGIRGMQRRCEKVRAQMKIHTGPGKGTVIVVRAPYGRRPQIAEWIESLRQRPPKHW